MTLNAYDNTSWDIVTTVKMGEETKSLVACKGTYDGDFNTDGTVKVTFTEESDEEGNLQVLEEPYI